MFRPKTTEVIWQGKECFVKIFMLHSTRRALFLLAHWTWYWGRS